ncbi:putative alpha-isocomene synthase [Helianthus debilis subsp. tardiflorus]
MFLAKFLAIETLLDDTYDAYGTFQELEIFTEAIKRYKEPTCTLSSVKPANLYFQLILYSSYSYMFLRWSVTGLDDLPESMKLIHRMLLDMYEDMEKILIKMGKAHHLNYSKEAVSFQYIPSIRNI